MVALLSMASQAWGFNTASQFYDLPASPHAASTSASAEGVYFTGAPRFAGQTCVACHVDGPQRLTIAVGAEPASLFSTGYEPGMVYELEIQLHEESRGTDYATPTCTEPLAPSDKYAYVPCNNNNFALEIDAVNGPAPKPAAFCASAPVGGACPPAAPSTDEVEVAPGGDAVFGNHPHSTVAGMQKVITVNGQARWRFFWTAPGAGTGPLTLYVGAVDGNGGDGTTTNDQDPYGDDAVSASITLQEAGDPAGFDATAGCELGRSQDTRLGFLLVGALLVVAVGSRRRRGGIPWGRTPQP